jgi:hypothetical protein
MIEQKIEGMGWNYKIDPKPYQSQKIIDDITEFSTNIDKELGKPGCGFMLALFHFSLDDINRFQNKMGYFPFDSSIDIIKKYHNPNFTYNDRNLILDILVHKNYLLMKGQYLYEVINNPYSKTVNRRRNLGILIPD